MFFVLRLRGFGGGILIRFFFGGFEDERYVGVVVFFRFRFFYFFCLVVCVYFGVFFVFGFVVFRFSRLYLFWGVDVCEELGF